MPARPNGSNGLRRITSRLARRAGLPAFRAVSRNLSYRMNRRGAGQLAVRPYRADDHLSPSASSDRVSEVLGDLEFHHRLGRNIDHGASRRITRLTGIALGG